jgi:hypothetical protein
MAPTPAANPSLVRAPLEPPPLDPPPELSLSDSEEEEAPPMALPPTVARALKEQARREGAVEADELNPEDLLSAENTHELTLSRQDHTKLLGKVLTLEASLPTPAPAPAPAPAASEPGEATGEIEIPAAEEVGEVTGELLMSVNLNVREKKEHPVPLPLILLLALSALIGLLGLFLVFRG